MAMITMRLVFQVLTGAALLALHVGLAVGTWRDSQFPRGFRWAAIIPPFAEILAIRQRRYLLMGVFAVTLLVYLGLRWA